MSVGTARNFESLSAPSSASMGSAQSTGAFDAFLGPTCTIEGSIKFDGNCELAGTVKGKVEATGSLHIAREGLVEGDINGVEVAITGEVRGNVTCEDRLKLLSGARIIGDISAPRMSIDDGVYFEGNCKMGAAAVSKAAPAPESDTTAAEPEQEAS